MDALPLLRSTMTTSPIPQLFIAADTSQSINLTIQKTWTVGRSSVNAIVLAEKSVSRHHAKFEVLDNRHCYFVDLNSSNGSQINHKQVTDPVLLKHGDVITIGSTEIRFNFPYVTHPGFTVPLQPKQVLMMQESAIQGIIWQEMLCSQEFDVQWLPPAANLQQRISLDAAANVLPDLLLVDLAAYNGDDLTFCAWCHKTYPHLPLLLTLSREASTPIVELNALLPMGMGKILPTLPSRELLKNIDIFAEQLRSVLNKVDGSTFNRDNLAVSLNSLEGILNRSSIAPLTANQIDDGADLDEFTLLNHQKKSLAS